jgi:hypothetical protein
VKSGGAYPIADMDAVEEVTVTLLGACDGHAASPAMAGRPTVAGLHEQGESRSVKSSAQKSPTGRVLG